MGKLINSLKLVSSLVKKLVEVDKSSASMFWGLYAETIKEKTSSVLEVRKGSHRRTECGDS